MAPEVDKTSPRMLDLMTFCPRPQKSTKLKFSLIFNDPETTPWEKLRVAVGSENYRFCQEPPRETMGAERAPRSRQEHPRAAKTGALVLAQ